MQMDSQIKWMNELKSSIYACKVKPSIIYITEAELSIDGYRMFANNSDENPRGIIFL